MKASFVLCLALSGLHCIASLAAEARDAQARLIVFSGNDELHVQAHVILGTLGRRMTSEFLGQTLPRGPRCTWGPLNSPNQMLGVTQADLGHYSHDSLLSLRGSSLYGDAPCLQCVIESRVRCFKTLPYSAFPCQHIALEAACVLLLMRLGCHCRFSADRQSL